MTSMANSVCMQISNMTSLDTQGACDINASINQSSFPSTQKTALAHAVQNKLTTQNATPMRRTGLQTLNNVCSYFTNSDWVRFESGCPLSQKTVCMVERLKLLHLFHPSEATMKNLAALLGTMHYPHAEATQLHSIVLEIKSSIHYMKMNLTVKHNLLLQYPMYPRDLPGEMFHGAYPNPADPPIDKTLANFQSTLTRVPLRITKKCLSPRRPDQQGGASSNNTPNIVQALLQQLLANNDSELPGLVIHNRRELRGSQLLRRPPSRASPLPLTFGMEPQGDGVPGAEAPVAGRHVEQPEESQTSDEPSAAAQRREIADGEVSAGQASGTNLGSRSGTGFGAESAAHRIDQIVSMAAGTEEDKFKDAFSPLGKGNSGKGHKGGKGKGAQGGKGKGKTKASGKAKAHPKGKAAAKAKTKAKAKTQPGGKAAAPPQGKGKLMLGCGKCRGSPKGCGQCRDPKYGGKRWQR